MREEAEAAYRRAKQFQRDAPEQRRHWRIGGIAPGEMARIFEGRQFVAMNAVAIADDEVHDQRSQRDVDQHRSIAEPDGLTRSVEWSGNGFRRCGHGRLNYCQLVCSRVAHYAIASPC